MLSFCTVQKEANITPGSEFASSMFPINIYRKNKIQAKCFKRVPSTVFLQKDNFKYFMPANTEHYFTLRDSCGERKWKGVSVYQYSSPRSTTSLVMLIFVDTAWA